MFFDYTLDDLKQATIGVLGGVMSMLLFFIFDTSRVNPTPVKPAIGLLVTLAFLTLVFYAIKGLGLPSKKALSHLVVDYILCILFATLFSLIFGVTSKEVIFSFAFFGSVPWVASWVLIIPTLIFDLKQRKSFLDAYTKAYDPVDVSDKCKRLFVNKKEQDECTRIGRML